MSGLGSTTSVLRIDSLMRTTSKRRVVVIGAGIGGLAAAARLARDGFDVRVVEKEAGPGGRCGRLEKDGFVWDIGPTILLLPDVLREHFAACGARLEDKLALTQCDPNYRMHFRDGSTLTMSADLRAMRTELDRLAPGSFQGFLKFMELGLRQKEIAFRTFLSRTFDGPGAMLRPATVLALVQSRSYRSLYAVVSECVEDERLRIALTFQTMYLGLSPFDGPALFGLLPYTELADGIWYAAGGLAAIGRALADLAVSAGVRIDYGCAVSRIERSGGRADAVVCASGERIEADVVLANADLPYVYRELLRQPLRRTRRFTSSAFMMFLGADRQWDSVLHHNVLFGGGYEQSFRSIFDERKVPDDPSFYVASPVRSDPAVAPEGSSALYVLLPVPHLAQGGLDWSDTRVVGKLRDHVLDRLEATIAPGIRASIRVEAQMTPVDWRDRFSLENGSAFGLSHTLTQVAGMRPPNRDASTKNLYFVGASTQPATGIPNVLIGAKHVAARIAEEHA
jgi:phytoene desaturase